MAWKLGSCVTMRQAYQQPEKIVTMSMPADWLIVSLPYATFQGLTGVPAQLLSV